MTIKRVALLFGGKSAEHDVSLRSARNIYDALDRTAYYPVLIWIAKDGAWFVLDESLFVMATQDEESLEKRRDTLHSVLFVPQGNGMLYDISEGKELSSVDVVFPVLHGPMGEDGTVQGVLKVADVPFVGAGVLGSAVSMDKDVMKRLLREAGLPVGRCVAMKAGEELAFERVVEMFGLPLFVKPANLGSSVGINKVRNIDEYEAAVKEAFMYDRKILIEEFIRGREIECSVLGNTDLKVSIPGEIVVRDDFYSYDTKYTSDTGAELHIPAVLTDDQIQRVQDIALRAYKALECEGMGRVDCFLTETGEVLVNEINTIPGFTSISMYPKLWEKSGIGYSELITQLIELAQERFAEEKRLRVS